MSSLALLFSALVGSAVPLQELPKEYDRFLNQEAVYIITPGERERFLTLQSDEEREDFVKNFWLVRDPIPETAVNEFKEEHLARIQEANRKYRESRAGWQTDRGRTYITLGEPQDVMSYPSSTDLYPLEIWYYYNLEIPLFPTSLQLIFYKRNGVGEYRLFSPGFDGMRALIADPAKRGIIGIQGQIPFSARQNWDVDIIKAAESVGPGENIMSSETVLADLRTPGFLFEKSHRNLDERVTATASFGEELPLDFSVDFFRGAGGFSDVHLALEIASEHLHVNQYDRRLLGRYDVVATLNRLGSDEVLEEIRDTLELELEESDWETVRHYPILFQTKVALLPGQYRLQVFVRDFVGRQLGIVDRVLSVPAFPTDRPSLSSLVTAFKADEITDTSDSTPLGFGHLRFYPRPNGVFGAGQRVLTFLEVYYPEEAFPTAPDVLARFTLKRGADEVVLDETNRYRASADAKGTVEVLKVVSGEALIPGDYTLEAVITESTTGFEDLARISFTVAEPQEMGRLTTVLVPAEDRPTLKYFREARHFMAAELYQEAIRRFAVALDYEPFFQDARLEKSRAEILSGQASEGEATAREALRRDGKDADAMALIGLALFRQGKLDAAAAMYREALATSGDVPALLNALGETEYERGDVAAAVKAFERSLELEPEQPDVRDFLGRIQRSQ